MPSRAELNPLVLDTIRQAEEAGMKLWQANARFTPREVALVEYYPMFHVI